MGYDDVHQEGVGRIPPQCGPQDDREATSERERRSVDIPYSGGRDGGSGTTGGGGLCLPLTEHGHKIHCDQAHYGPESGGGAETGAKYIQSVVGVL